MLSEVWKLATVRSVVGVLAGMVAFTVAVSALACWATGTPSSGSTAFDSASRSMVGIVLGQLFAAVFGVLAISSEYSTGAIRSSLIAQPRRGLLYLAKLLTVTATVLPTALATCFLSFAVGQGLLARYGLATSLEAPHVLRAVLGGAVYLTGWALIGFGLGCIARSAAGALTMVVFVLFLLPAMLGLLNYTLSAFLAPAPTGFELWATTSPPADPPLLLAAAIFTAYPVLLTSIGALRFTRWVG